MSSAYTFTGGRLRFKSNALDAVQAGKVSKKRKHKSKSKSSSKVEVPSSKMEHVATTINNFSADQHAASASGSFRRDLRTPAEIAFAQATAKSAKKRIFKKAATSHKEQVQALNSYLDRLTEINDYPKLSWTK